MKMIELKRKRGNNNHKGKWIENPFFRLLLAFTLFLALLMILLYYLLPGILNLLSEY